MSSETPPLDYAAISHALVSSPLFLQALQALEEALEDIAKVEVYPKYHRVQQEQGTIAAIPAMLKGLGIGINANWSVRAIVKAMEIQATKVRRKAKYTDVLEIVVTRLEEIREEEAHRVKQQQVRFRATVLEKLALQLDAYGKHCDNPTVSGDQQKEEIAEVFIASFPGFKPIFEGIDKMEDATERGVALSTLLEIIEEDLKL